MVLPLNDNEWRMEIVERLTRVETRLDDLSEDTKELISSYKLLHDSYTKEAEKIFTKLEMLEKAVHRIESIPRCNTGLSKKEKAAIYSALIAAISGIIIQLLKLLPIFI